MPVFTDSTTIDTQYASSWDTFIRDDLPTTNSSSSTYMQCNKLSGRTGDIFIRSIVAFDLSDLANRNIISGTLTMKTKSGIIDAATWPCNIYKLNESVLPIYDEVTWNNRTDSAGWVSAGGDFSTGTTSTISWPVGAGVSFTSSDMLDLLSGEEGGMVHFIIKTEETATTNTMPVFAHDEGSSSQIDDLPILNITSTIDHHYVWNKNQMTKYMNKSRGLVGKSTIPSISKH